MGICLSKVETETETSNSNSTISSGSVPPIPRSEGEILQSSLRSFTFDVLREATRNFSRGSILGAQDFGVVFEGWVDGKTLFASKPGAGIVIAVKKLNQQGLQGHCEWLSEINYLGQLRHPNLVRLIGYCLEDDHRLLVYEFMPHGSMEDHLFMRSSDFEPLSWSIRMKVAIGVARGLAFLHNAEISVIFRDFKTANILLDSNYNAKLSDFGLARDGPTDDQSHVSTRVMGTLGYVDPEYLSTGHLSAKSDVYSFGVVLLEILSGKKVIGYNRQAGGKNLVEWSRPYLTSKRRIFRVLDSRLEGQYSLTCALKVANIALQCLAKDTKSRPTMDEVVTALEQLQESKDTLKNDTNKDQQLNRLKQSIKWRVQQVMQKILPQT